MMSLIKNNTESISDIKEKLPETGIFFVKAYEKPDVLESTLRRLFSSKRTKKMDDLESYKDIITNIQQESISFTVAINNVEKFKLVVNPTATKHGL